MDSLVTLRMKAGRSHHVEVQHEKRTVSVSVKMKPSDLEKIKRAADKLWPGAVLTQSGVILGLALLCADRTLKKKI